MNLPWFKRIGLFFIPISIIAWMVVLTGLLYAVYVFIDIDSNSHSVSDTLVNYLYNLLIIAALYSLIGYLTCRNPYEE